MVDKDLETQDGAQEKADAAESAAESYADGEIESHRQNETHDTAQPPENHGNQAHITDFLDATEYTPEADTHDRYTDTEAAGAAPVQDVNGQTGSVTVDTGVTDHSNLENVQPGQHFSPKVAIDAIQFETAISDSTERSLPHNYGEVSSEARAVARLEAEFYENDLVRSLYDISIGGDQFADFSVGGFSGGFVTYTFEQYFFISPGGELVVDGERDPAVRNLTLEVSKMV